MTTETPEIKIKIEYTRRLQTRYISHLDNVDILTKALRRIGLPYNVTQGCHKRPKLSFSPPLPLGHASNCEYVIVSLSQEIDTEALERDLNKQLPEGMRVIEITQPWIDKKKVNLGEMVSYRLYFKNLDTANTSLKYLTDPSSSFKSTHKGKLKSYEIGEAVLKSNLTEQADSFILELEFKQGMAGIPSVSKIITALSEHLDNSKDNLFLIERLSLTEF
jgi:radical SAM-linked protein